MSARWEAARKIARRVVVTGTLVLETPARFGNGETDEQTDMPLARDPKEGKALLTGASIAGALRNYLREWEHGYGVTELAASRVRLLFGAVTDKESRESYLVVEDALADGATTELRDGVAIDPATRTAESGKLFDYELLEAGTAFPLRFELAVPESDDSRLVEGLAVALTGFERGEIGLGARKRRGLGACKVTSWNVESYELKTGAGLLAWIEGRTGATATGEAIAEKLGLSGKVDDIVPDLRKRFTLDATFRLETSLLIRSGVGDGSSADMIHLKSRRNGKPMPILSGTSLAGALRARALRIAKTIDAAQADSFVNGLFGPRFSEDDKEKWASRALVHESEVTEAYERVQSRVRIDRFTGGSYPTALFTQQPAYGGKNTHVKVKVEVRNPAEEEIGLLLHLLRDLWTGDLPLGGEASVGRGRLQGVQATLSYDDKIWVITEADHRLVFAGNGDRDELNRFARAAGGQTQ